MLTQINIITDYLQDKITPKPNIGLILGSGLGVLANEIKEPKKINYDDIPHFPVATVTGHSGQLVSGYLENKKVIAMQGRVHYYEGYTMQEITIPVRVMRMLGVNKLIVTNAAGGINLDFNPGDLMIITDHINLMGNNPLRGEYFEELGLRFPDMTAAYKPGLKNLTEKTAVTNQISIKKGIYVGVHGPCYETPAEIRYLRTIGADAVGMSTVPEVIVANQVGLEVLGISCITNMAAGVMPQPLDHRDVMQIAEKVKPKFIKLLKAVLKEM